MLPNVRMAARTSVQRALERNLKLGMRLAEMRKLLGDASRKEATQ